MAKSASKEGRDEGIFVIITLIMISSSDIFLIILLMASGCAPAEEKTLGIMDIRCLGIPAVPEWAMQTIQEELRQGTAFHLQRIRPIPPKKGQIHPDDQRRNRLQRIGEYYQVDLVFDGSIERIADRLLIGWRLVVVHHPTNEYFWVNDYNYDPERLEEVIRSSLRQFLEQLGVTRPVALHYQPT